MGEWQGHRKPRLWMPETLLPSLFLQGQECLSRREHLSWWFEPDRTGNGWAVQGMPGCKSHEPPRIV